MTELRYPIGVQTFSEIIEDGMTYVDKTHFIPLLIKSKYIFLSRPRRFGKSLLLSTLEAYFEGKRHLFRGLALDSMDVDWDPSPVLHFDFNSGVYETAVGLVARLSMTLETMEMKYGLPTASDTRELIPLRFERIIKQAAEMTGRKVVILVDEYDKPLLGLEKNREVFEDNQRLLKSLFGNLKSMDRYIRFAFLTGVARFSKVSIFSDINHLKDISLDDQFSDICGWTEEELVGTFRQGIEKLALRRKEEYATTLSVLRDYYDGYRFTSEGSRLYNPFSVLRALDSLSIEPYWFESATPSFLFRMIVDNAIDPADINGHLFSKRELMQVRIGARNPIPLMFQTGYLTIDSYDEELDGYTLRFPNREVEVAFSEDLLPVYFEQSTTSDEPFNIVGFRKDLAEGDPVSFMKRLATAFKDLPVEDQREGTYRAVTYLLCKVCGMDTRTETHSYKGRSDMEVFTRRYVYLFEFKYNKSSAEAMEQIHSRDYAGRYALDARTVFLIGVNYCDKKENRGLTYEIQTL